MPNNYIILPYFFCSFAHYYNGGLAHQVERQVRNLKAAGSSPVSSTFIVLVIPNATDEHLQYHQHSFLYTIGCFLSL